MKKTLLLLTLFSFVLFQTQSTYAQDAEGAAMEQQEATEETDEDMDDEEDMDESDTADADQDTMDLDEAADEMMMDEEEDEEAEEAAALTEEDVEDKRSGQQIIKDYYIEGGNFMLPVLICLIIGLAVCIERILNLNLKTINTGKFLRQIEEKLESKDIEGAQEIARNTKGPVASIFYQALERREEGIDVVEKSIISYGSVQMALLEKGLSWISLFIAIAPMLGFMGTVIGMIEAFDQIEAAGDISPSLVAGGIKTALLTTVAGLIVAIILQIFYNYLVAKVDGMVGEMEDTSISLIDMLTKHKAVATGSSSNQKS